MNKPILLFGGTSIIGFNLSHCFPNTIHPYVPSGNKSPSVQTWPTLQLENINWIKTQIETHQPEAVIYAHAVCDVTKCEKDPDWAYDVNVSNLKRVISVLPEKTRLIYISSDHVFGGDGQYDESSTPSPISIYGRTRVEAEHCVLKRAGSLVIRTGLAIGPSPDGRTGHMDWLRYRSEQNLPITIIEDEFRSVVWAKDLSHRMMLLLKSDEVGLRHVPAVAISRVSLAKHLMSLLGIKPIFKIERREQQQVPHLGQVELTSLYQDALSQAMPPVGISMKSPELIKEMLLER